MMVQEIEYTNHALERMHFRQIRPSDIESVLTAPDTTESKGDIRVSHGLIEGRLLRVFYRKDSNKYTIITSYYTTKKKYLGGRDE